MEQATERVYLAALAGLLHDLGKLAQRAGERGSRIWPDAEARRDYGYYHALLSADVAQKVVPEPWRDPVALAAGGHHRPGSDLAALVQLADHLSAAEREEDEDNRVPYLRSVFSLLKGYDDRPAYLPLAILDPASDSIYPQEGSDAPWRDDHVLEYERLWSSFLAEAGGLAAGSLQAYFEALLDLVQRYTWAVPSAYYRTLPDVSLYDHCRMTAALAACLAADGADRVWVEQVLGALYEGGEAGIRPVARLVGGDVSGIQDFLYTMASGGAAKSLRGRSFYLQLLTEAAALSFLDALHLPLSNLIYCGGGHFYILAPTEDRFAQAISRQHRQLADVLLRAHEGRLYLAVGTLLVPAQRFVGGAFQPVWGELHAIVNRDKRRRFAVLGQERLAQIVGVPLDQGGHPDELCMVCGREGDWAEDQDGLRKCPFCRSLEALGNQLRVASGLLLSTVARAEEPGPVHHWRDGLRALGLDVEVLREDQRSVTAPSDASLVRLWRFREGLPIPQVTTSAPLVQSRHFMALLAPRVRDHERGGDRVATLEDLAEASGTALKQWGILRMDVDDLGDLFQRGLGERATLSRVASLSFLLRLFFEGHLPSLVARYNDYSRTGRPTDRDRAYVMYSGGDDLFIVGTWEVLPDLAHDIREAFRRFVAGNPKITLSAGITIRSQRYPIYLAADEAGQALDAGAKRHQRLNGDKKDALAFLGEVIGWEEYGGLRRQVSQWEQWVRQGVAPRAMLQLLRRVADEHRHSWERAYRECKVRRGQRYLDRWAWRLVYA